MLLGTLCDLTGRVTNDKCGSLSIVMTINNHTAAWHDVAIIGKMTAAASSSSCQLCSDIAGLSYLFDIQVFTVCVCVYVVFDCRTVYT